MICLVGNSTADPHVGNWKRLLTLFAIPSLPEPDSVWCRRSRNVGAEWEGNRMSGLVAMALEILRLASEPEFVFLDISIRHTRALALGSNLEPFRHSAMLPYQVIWKAAVLVEKRTESQRYLYLRRLSGARHFASSVSIKAGLV